jgi:hypothetical protein
MSELVFGIIMGISMTLAAYLVVVPADACIAFETEKNIGCSRC